MSFYPKTYQEALAKVNKRLARKPKTLSKRAKMTPKQRQKLKEKERYGIKLWSTTKCDIKFSKWLRDKVGKCEKCGTTEGLTCSHYIGRREYATRWLEENCDVLCFSCHAEFEPRKQYEYKIWKQNKMGVEAEEELSKLKYGYKGASEAKLDCMKLLGIETPN